LSASNICIVDDDGAVRESLQLLFERQGWTVFCYPSAEIFLSRIHRVDCACLILDQLLPGLTGLKLLEMLRGRGLVVPTVMLTGDSDPALPRKAREAGALSVLHKPASNDVLLAEIRQVLASRGVCAANT
jgi:FixJ family two-component response regulator